MTFLLLIVVVVLFFYLRSQTKRIEHIERYLEEQTRQQSAGAQASVAASDERVESVHPSSQASVEPVVASEVVPKASWDAVPNSGDADPSQSSNLVEQNIENESAQTAVSVRQIDQPEAIPDITPATDEPDAFDNFLAWCREDWLLKLGALLVLIGMGWFVGYAFVQGWIGPVGRILLGLVTGFGLLAFGYHRMVSHNLKAQGEIFAVLGSSVVLATTFAAQSLYEIFPTAIASLIMLTAVAAVALISIQFTRFNLAIMSLLMAFVVPFLSVSGDPSLILLTVYLLVVSMGVWLMVEYRGWFSLAPIAFVGVFLHSVLWLPESVKAAEAGLALEGMFHAYLLGGFYFLMSTYGCLKRGLSSVAITQYISLSAGVGFYLLLWILLAGQPELQVIHFAFWTALFMAGGVSIFKITNQALPLATYGGVAAVFLVAFTAKLLSGPTFVLAYAVETFALIMLIHVFIRNRNYTNTLLLLLLGPVLLSLESMASPAWETGIWHADFAVLVLLLLLSIGSSLLTAMTPTKDGVAWGAVISFSALALGYLYALTWLIVEPTELALVLHILETWLVILYVYFKFGAKPALVTSWLMVLPMMISLSSIFSSRWDEGIVHLDALVIVSLLGAFTTFLYVTFVRPSQDSESLSGLRKIYLVFSLLYLFILTTLVFHRHGLQVVTQLYTLEILALVVGSWLVTGSFKLARLACMLFVVPALMSLGALTAESWDQGVFHQDFFALLTLGLSFSYIAFRLYVPSQTDDETTEDRRELSGIFAIAGTLYLCLLVWLSTHAALPEAPDQATALSLFIYTLLGVTSYLAGVKHNHRFLLYYGGIIIGLVLLRLIVVDVWAMEMIGRIITFLAIGILLMSTTFVHFKDRQEEV